MWERFLPYIFPRRSEKRGLTVADMNRMDTVVVDETAFDYEKVIVVNGDVFGETAIITEENSLQPTGGPLPPQSIPLPFPVLAANKRRIKEATFGPDSDGLIAAGKCIAYLYVKFRDDSEAQIATAFFIGPKHLLTAAHSLHKRDSSCESIQLIGPGIPHIDVNKFYNNDYATVDCDVIGTYYDVKGPYQNDIALLYSGSFNSPHFIQLSTVAPLKGENVDVIGYPGPASEVWMSTQGKLNDITTSLARVAKLLPNRRLSVSRGTVEATGDIISYNLSTVPGMSGSCVVYQGKAIGLTHRLHG